MDLTIILFPATRSERIIQHLLFWPCFVVFHLLYFVPISYDYPVTKQMVFAYALYYGRYIPLFYCCLYAYRLFRKRLVGITLLFISLIACIVIMHIMTILMFLLANWLLETGRTASSFQMLNRNYLDFVNGIQLRDIRVLIYDLLDLSLLILPIGIKVAKFGIIVERRRQDLEKENLKTELVNLKNQLSPHFIFNVINAAFAVILPVSNKAADYLAKVSEILRFTLYEASKGMISLKQEIECIRNITDLESLRTGNRAAISFIIKGTIRSSHQVPALLLVSLVENAFKHGVHTDYQESFVEISVTIESNNLKFQLRNSKPILSKITHPKTDSSGIGLANISRRLHLQYGDEYSFKITETIDTYMVRLLIPLIPKKSI